MADRVGRFLPLGVAWALAAWWSISMVYFQPLTERISLNHLYWARDVRFSVMVLALAVFVWARRGDRSAVRTAVLAAVGWVTLDVLLDRADITGAATCAALAVALGAALTGLWWLAGRTAPRPSPPTLTVVATVAAGVAGLMGLMLTATDGEPGLTASGLVIGGLGLVTAVGCAQAAAPGRTTLRALVGAGLLTCAAAVLGRRADFGLGWATSYPAGTVTMLALAVPLVAIVVFTGAARTARGALLAAAGILLSVYGVTFVVVIGTTLLVDLSGEYLFGDWLTTLAGNTAVNTADSDLLMTLPACLIGLLYGLAIVTFGRLGVGRLSPEPGNSMINSTSGGLPVAVTPPRLS